MAVSFGFRDVVHARRERGKGHPAHLVCADCRVVWHQLARDTVISLAEVPPHDIVRLRMI
jgi:hypothetical protein